MNTEKLLAEKIASEIQRVGWKSKIVFAQHGEPTLNEKIFEIVAIFRSKLPNTVFHMYSNGYGVAQNYAEAVKWYRLSAEQGEATAQYNLGYMYEYGRGVAQDYTQAMRWYRQAADQGHKRAIKSYKKLKSKGY